MFSFDLPLLSVKLYGVRYIASIDIVDDKTTDVTHLGVLYRMVYRRDGEFPGFEADFACIRCISS